MVSDLLRRLRIIVCSGAILAFPVFGHAQEAALSGTVWQVAYGFQVSGLYFYGSGERYGTNYGGTLRGTGATGSARLRPNGTIVPRNNLVGTSLHRVDMRMFRRFPIGRINLEGSFEVFNLFNHANYGSFVIDQANRLYGQPQQNLGVSYQPRMAQLGFQVTF